MAKKHGYSNFSYSDAEAILDAMYNKVEDKEEEGCKVYYGDNDKKEVTLRKESRTGSPTIEFFSLSSKKSKAAEKLRLTFGFGQDYINSLSEDEKNEKERLKREKIKKKSISIWDALKKKDEEEEKEKKSLWGKKKRSSGETSSPFFGKDKKKEKNKPFWTKSKPFYKK